MPTERSERAFQDYLALRDSRSLQKLDFDQFDFICDVLEREVIDGRMSRREFRSFEHFYDRWWAHSLPLKLAFLDRIVSLTQGYRWPTEVFPELGRLNFLPSSARDRRRLYEPVTC